MSTSFKERALSHEIIFKILILFLQSFVRQAVCLPLPKAAIPHSNCATQLLLVYEEDRICERGRVFKNVTLWQRIRIGRMSGQMQRFQKWK